MFRTPRQREAAVKAQREKWSRYSRDAINFMESEFILENRRPIVLESWEKDLLNSLYRDGKKQKNLCLLLAPKKVGKSTLAGAIALWETLFGDADSEVYFISNSLEQAVSLSFDRMCRAIRRNPILRAMFKLGRTRAEVRGRESFCQVLPCRAESAAGRNPSAVFVDECWGLEDASIVWELTHSPARSGEMLTFFSTYPSHDLAGWLHQLHQRGLEQTDPGMLHVWHTDSRISSWISEQYLAQQKLRLPPLEYARLHQALWVADAGAVFTKRQIDACVDRSLQPRRRGEWNWRPVCAVDLGLCRDATAGVIAHLDQDDVLTVDQVATWQGSAEEPVRISDVEAWLLEQIRNFPHLQVVCDEWQMRGSVQRLRSAGAAIQGVHFTSEFVRRLSTSIYERVLGQKLRMFPHERLEQEMLRAEVKVGASGWRFDHQSGFFSDHLVSLALCSLFATERAAVGTAQFVSIPRRMSSEGLESVTQAISRSFEGNNPDSGWVNIGFDGLYHIRDLDDRSVVALFREGRVSSRAIIEAGRGALLDSTEREEVKKDDSRNA